MVKKITSKKSKHKLTRNIGERSPVRRRLEGIVPPVWNLCEANTAMFATIAQFNKDKSIKGMKYAPLERLIETEETESRSHVPIQPGAW